MRIFNELVFDEYMEGQAQYRRFHWWPVLGNFETLRFFGVADLVPTTVSLNLTLYQLPTFSFTYAKALMAVSESLSAGQTTQFTEAMTPTSPGMPASGYYALVCSLATASRKAHVRIWVTGRGRA
jgi:hypothetical protein